MSNDRQILFVTGLSGAGKSTVLDALEDCGWETVDNFPIRLAKRLLDMPLPVGQEDELPLAIGFDARTRGLDPARLIERIRGLSENADTEVSTLFLDCDDLELIRRYSETRRRHPMAPDRALENGIALERELLTPFKQFADIVIDTSQLSASDISARIRHQFATRQDGSTVIQVSSFGFSHGLPPAADLVFDVRFLRNPHWDQQLRPMTGLDAVVGDYIRADSSFEEAVKHFQDLLSFLLPRYEALGKAYVNIAFGCTGGRHRSVYMTELIAKWLVEQGYSPQVTHRNLRSHPCDTLESDPS